jgi:TrmH family RNA methyltransferase
MLIERIVSRQNPLVKRFRRVRMGSERHLVLIEGVRLIEEALKSGAHFESVAFTSSLETDQRGQALLEALRQVPCRGAHVTEHVMEVISDTETPQGVAAIISRPYYELGDIFAARPEFVVIADQLQDPGNIGTIIRTAEAAGASGLIATRGTVDPFNRKALRASAGSALRLPIATGVKLAEALDECQKRSIKIVAASPHHDKRARIYAEANLTAPLSLVLGGEAGGIAEEVTSRATLLVRIPMARGVESLNVAAAAAVLLYEAARQCGFPFQSEIRRAGRAR